MSIEQTQPLVDPAFVQVVTGLDVTAYAERVDALIDIVSQLTAEYAGTVLDPEAVRMVVKIDLAEFIADTITSRPDGDDERAEQVVRAEQVGDYRVEYRTPGALDIDDLEARLARRGLRPTATTVSTLPDYGKRPGSDDYLVAVIEP